MLALHVLQNSEQFEQLAPEWRALLKASACDGVFLSWEWLFTWWKHLAAGRSLHIITLREGRDLAGIAPLVLRPSQPRRLLPFRVLEFLGGGNVGSDYPDVIAARGAEQPVIAKLSDYLVERKLAVELSRIRTEALSHRLLGTLSGREYTLVAHGAKEICPYIRLQGLSWESYLAGLGASHRYNVRRRLRNLSRSFQVHFRQAQLPSECDAWLSQLVKLHRKRWSGGERASTAFNQPELVAFHREFAALALQRGWLRLQLLHLNDTPAAALYGLHYAGVFYFYQSGFDPVFFRHSIGLVTLALAIQSAIAEGTREFDLLHGDENYKFLWTREQHELSRCTLFPPGMRGRMCRQVLGVRENIKRLMRLPTSAAAPAAGTAAPSLQLLQ
ncbi:MAG TPA: GNAT family N-acetyltransferase [Gammaproteobacteria bacterium]|nr:GNAT family N-acetyltransferase [Gammaproteobacteria bacterium]